MSARTWIVGAMLLIAAAVACWLRWQPLDSNDLVGGDEGYYGTTARNLLADPRGVISPSLSPLGGPGDKPPLYPALLALSLATWGPSETALRWPSVAFAAAIALGVGLLVRRASGAWPAWATVAALLLLPWFADASLQVAAEIPLTALGTGALLLATSAPLRRGHVATAGLLLGLGFLCKLWLIVLFALPVVLAIAWPWSGPRPRWTVTLLVVAGIVGVSHLLSVAIAEPGALRHWWGIYLGRSLVTRVGGGGYASYWLKPAGFYWGLLTHACVSLLPLVLCGVAEAVRRFREPVPRSLLLWAGGTLVLSGFAVKSGEYAYVVAPAWVALAGLGVGGLAAGRMPPGWAIAVAAAGTSPWLVRGLGGQPLSAGPWLAVWLALVALRIAASRRPAWSVALTTALALIAILPGLPREAQRMKVRYHATGYRSVAAALAPRLAAIAPATPCFVSPEAPALQFYLFRTGGYWSTPYLPWSARRRTELQADTLIRAFVVDPEQRWYGGGPDPEMLRWLESSTTEIGWDAQGRYPATSRLRVFVRPGPGPGAVRAGATGPLSAR